MIRRSWTQTASIEETLGLWAASLREVKKRIRPLFGQERVARNAGLFLEGLLGDEQRKTGWMRAEAAGDPGPWRQQAILGQMEMRSISPCRCCCAVNGNAASEKDQPPPTALVGRVAVRTASESS